MIPGVTAEATAPLALRRPHPLWSEQDPDSWVEAAENTVKCLPSILRSKVKGVGLSGQMHGATLLDANDRVLRPAILWNDGRSHLECAEIELTEPRLRDITGNKAMPGLTAPKLAWVRKHEPDVFAKTAKVLLPKDYLRLRWTQEYATDLSDASGTLWLDVGLRAWSEEALAATGLKLSHMPAAYEGTEVTGYMSGAIAAKLGIPKVPVVAGGGDQAAGAVGAGVVRPGDASLALGTSGVLFVVTRVLCANPEEGAHAFCHALPDLWHQMAVILSAASAVDWAASLLRFSAPEEAYAAAQAQASSGDVLFLPYISGERTPHDNPHASGLFFGLKAETEVAELVHAVLEGVAFAFADGHEVLKRAGGACETATVIGSGARSEYWGKIISSAHNIPLIYREGSEVGPARGAAHLARLAVTGEDDQEVCRPAPVRSVIEPDAELTNLYAERLPIWRALYC